jgi:rare lipoprotein A
VIRAARLQIFHTAPGQFARYKSCSFLRLAAACALALVVAAGCAHRTTVARQPVPAPQPLPPSNVPSQPSGPPPATERQPAVAGAYTEEGVASWYGNPFDGRRTSDGEIYDMHQFTAAHRTLPFGALVRVTNLSNGMQTEVRINDRGPFVANRVIDLSLSAAQAIGMVGPGTAHVRLEMISGPNPQLGFFGVQVGAFAVEANAEKLRMQLSARYSPVSIVPFNSPNGNFFRVRVGRVPTEAAATEIATQLQAEQFTTFIVRLDN